MPDDLDLGLDDDFNRLELDRTPASEDVHDVDVKGRPLLDGDYRRMHTVMFKNAKLARRVGMAKTANGAELGSLCFDPDPQVIGEILKNPGCGPVHWRLIAKHHRNSTGLNALGKIAMAARDGQVRRWLFRNPVVPEALLRRLLANRRMLEVYRLAQGKEAGERTRRAALALFKEKFQSAGAEEKVALIMKTEGRCLKRLSGVPLDGAAVGLLCRRSFTSVTVIRNLATWGPATPPLLQHLYKQSLVRRNHALKTVILRHPNCPPNLKSV